MNRSIEKVGDSVKVDCGQVVLSNGNLGDVIPVCRDNSVCRNRGTYFVVGSEGVGVYLCGIHRKKPKRVLYMAKRRIGEF